MTSAQTATGEPTPSPLTMTAAFEGIEGSYSHAVLEAYAARRGVAFVPLGCSSYRGVAHAVLSGRADLGLLPIDNAIAGTIREGYDVARPSTSSTCSPRSRGAWSTGCSAFPARRSTVCARSTRIPSCWRNADAFSGRSPTCGAFPVPDTGVAARDVAAAADRTPRRDRVGRRGAALRSGRARRHDRRPSRQLHPLRAVPRAQRASDQPRSSSRPRTSRTARRR